MIRCFFGFRIADAARDELGAMLGRLRRHDANVAWVPTENLHVTLRFIGDISDNQLRQLRALAATHIARPFTIRALGLGAFPGLRNPRTIWSGVQAADEHDLERLTVLQSLTETWSRAIGAPPETRRFTPHITLGRVRRATPQLRSLMDEITTAEFAGRPTVVSSFELIESVLSDQAARYETIEAWTLAEKIRER